MQNHFLCKCCLYNIGDQEDSRQVEFNIHFIDLEKNQTFSFFNEHTLDVFVSNVAIALSKWHIIMCHMGHLYEQAEQAQMEHQDDNGMINYV